MPNPHPARPGRDAGLRDHRDRPGPAAGPRRPRGRREVRGRARAPGRALHRGHLRPARDVAAPWTVHPATSRWRPSPTTPTGCSPRWAPNPHTFSARAAAPSSGPQSVTGAAPDRPRATLRAPARAATSSSCPARPRPGACTRRAGRSPCSRPRPVGCSSPRRCATVPHRAPPADRTPVTSATAGCASSPVPGRPSHSLLGVTTGLRIRLQRAVHGLTPGYFALVMGSGIISVGMLLAGHTALSALLLVVCAAAFVVLVALTGWRLLRFRDAVADDFTDPGAGSASSPSSRAPTCSACGWGWTGATRSRRPCWPSPA